MDNNRKVMASDAGGVALPADRAVASGADAGSALRASIPSAVTLVSRRERLVDLPDRFAAQYAHYKTAPWKNDEPIALIVERLRALDLAECDYRDVVAAMGSDWTELECDICGKKDCETVSRIGDEPAYEARWQDICLPCLASIGAWAAQAMAARSGETSGSTEGNSAVRKDAPIGGHDDD